MKNIFIISSISLLILCCNSFTRAQKHTLDSIEVVLDNKTEINLAIYNYKQLSDNLKTDYTTLVSILKEKSEIPEQIFYSINYNPDKSVSIKQSNGAEKTLWENEKQTDLELNNQCNIHSEYYLLNIKFNNIQDILNDSLLIRLLEAVNETEEINDRISKTYAYSFQGMQITKDEQINITNKSLDVIFLKGGVGVSLIKSEPIIDISAEIGIGLANKGIIRNQYYFSYNLMFDFMEESKTNLNGFLNLGYRRNLSNNNEKPNWLGVELGYLIHDQGELFGKNTFKLGVNWELGKYISISPQLYMSDDFKELYPAVRVGIGF